MSNNKAKGISFFTSGVITTISIALVLFLLGLIFLVGFTGKSFSEYFKENMAISVEIDEKAADADILALKTKLTKNPYVKEAKYISKEEIKEQLIRDLGRDPEEVLGYNPARSFYDVYIKSDYVNPDSIKLVESSLKGLKPIKNIVYSEDDISLANSNLTKVGTVLLILAAILLTISFVLIHSTIQLNIYAKRFLINTMQLVGATNGFIRRPFIGQMVLNGVVAAILANLGLTAFAYYAVKYYPELANIVSPEEMIFVYVLVLIAGIAITALAAIVAVNRFLRMTTNKLYHI
ncbi:cell division protein FtsX [Dysgonomonas massiliensis]|uniref:cell division protein FtsX n=1 Tax=Dysgonomonas massiliensis TaxID=2040292 RepID=UPI000C77337E|nr:permease-like cell division protein FtsX [Dysgonomonas massiliensis]